MLDPNNAGTVISPVISGFLFEVMPYVSSLGNLNKDAKLLLEFATFLKDKLSVTAEDLTLLVDRYEGLQKCGVHLDKHTEKFSEFFDDISISLGDKDELEDFSIPVYKNILTETFNDMDKIKEAISNVITVCEEVLSEEFLPDLKTTNVVLGGIQENLIAFGKAFGCSELVEKANLQEPHSVEAETKEVEESYEPQLEEVPKEELMQEYLKGFGYYRDYDERTLYFSGMNDALLNYMVGYLQKNGALAKRDGEAYKTAQSSFESGSSEYTLIKFVMNIKGTLHRASLYLPSTQASRACSMCLKVKQQIGA